MVAQNRTYKLKRIFDPKDAANYVDIPIIAEQWFMNLADQAQEWQYIFDNTDAAKRDVNVVTVHDESGGGGDIQVERIKSFQTKSMADQAQEFDVFETNEDEPPKHLKTHDVKYYQNNNTSSSNWVKTQYIDEALFKVMADQAQETHFFLTQPKDGDPVDISLDHYAFSSNVDPPYRTDPWQNIIGVHWGETSTGSSDFDLLLTGGAGWNSPTLDSEGVPFRLFSLGVAQGNSEHVINLQTISGHAVRGTLSAPSVVSVQVYEGNLLGTPDTSLSSYGTLSVSVNGTLDGVGEAGPLSQDYSSVTFTNLSGTQTWHALEWYAHPFELGAGVNFVIRLVPNTA